MARELFTTWGEYQAGIDRILAMAETEVRVYDQDLGLLKLEGGTRLTHLERLLHAKRADTLQVALRDTEPFRNQQPRLFSVFTAHADAMAVQQTPDHLASLRDSMILVDGHHGLIRFDVEQPRSKLLIDEAAELLPYLRRFEELWAEGGTPVSPTTLGL